MRKWLPVFIIFIVILGGIWYWSLGALPPLEASSVVLKQIDGNVTVKAPGEDAFTQANVGEVLEDGATVRTGSLSQAVIDFYGQAETTINEGSELEITQAMLSEENQSPIVHLSLLSGRIWSRVISILDLEGEFTAQTSDVVATVRGTSFDLAIEDGGTTLWVADSVVEADNTETVFIPENQMMRFQKGKTHGEMQALTSQSKRAKWFANNRARDDVFDKEMQDRVLTIAGADQSRVPGLFRDIVRSSEGVRTVFSHENRRGTLVMRYMLRHIAVIRDQLKKNQLGGAQQEFSKFRQEVIQANNKGSIDTRAAHQALLLGVKLFHNIDSTSAAYPLKQQMEELLLTVTQNKERAMMLRLMFVQSRLSEAKKAMMDDRLDAAEQILALAKQSHENVARDMGRMDTNESSMKKLTNTLRAIEARMAHLETALTAVSQATPVQDITVLPIQGPQIATSTPATGIRCTDLYIRATPPTINIGEAARISVQATFTDGQTKDVSQEALIVVTGGIVTLSGTTVTGVKAGSASVQVTYTCQGEALARQGAINVKAGISAQGLLIRPSAGQMNILQELPLQAEMLYSDGHKKDVTQNASFTNLTPNLGFAAGNRFVAGQTTGTARMQVEYTENGKTFTSISNITIQNVLP